MSTHLSANEWTQSYVDTMGPKLGPLFSLLVNECVILHLEWGEFKEIYCTNEQRIELLNRSARAFFVGLRRTVLDAIHLRIARIIDPPNSGGGKDNVTLLALPGLVDTNLRGEVEVLAKAATQMCGFASGWRNRRIAHKDLSLALKVDGSALHATTIDDIESALERIATLLNRVEAHYCGGSSVAYSFVDSSFGAKALLDVLREGIDARDARMLRLRSGNPLPEDLGPGRTM